MNYKIISGIILSLSAISFQTTAEISKNINKKTGCPEKETICVIQKLDVFKEKVDSEHYISLNGIYDKDSSKVDINQFINNEKYNHIIDSSSSSNDGVIADYKEKTVYYVKSIDQKSNDHDEKDTKVNTSHYNSGINVLGFYDFKNTYQVDITQKYFDRWDNIKKDNQTIDVPVIQKWNSNQKYKINNDKIIRLDSPVYVDKGNKYRNIYLISVYDETKNK